MHRGNLGLATEGQGGREMKVVECHFDEAIKFVWGTVDQGLSGKNLWMTNWVGPILMYPFEN